MAKPVVIRGGTVLTMDAKRRVMRADLLIRDGAIAKIGPTRSSGARVLDASECLVMPGLVQTHIHLCQVLFRGLADDLPLLQWLRRRIWPLEAAHDAPSLRTSARLGIAELLLGGTTTILDMGTVHHQDVVFEVMEETGIRGFSGKAMMDRGRGVPRELREQTRASLDDTEALAKRWHGRGRLGYGVAPRFWLATTRELMEGCADLAQRCGLLLHTHSSEHPSETDLVRADVGLANVEALHSVGLTGKNSVFAHCVHINARERRLLAETETSVAHCPSANLKLGSGIADIIALRTAGITVGLGSDGAPCNNLLDTWTEMRLAGLLASAKHRPGQLRAMDLLSMATRDGARALGLEKKIGSIEVGKRADIIIIQPGIELDPGSAPPSRIAWAGRPSHVRDVLIDGQVVVRNRQLRTIDLERTRAQARVQSRRVSRRAAV